jgi:hypothetical protein
MMSFAKKRHHVETNPFTGLEFLPEEELPCRIMTLPEERKLVGSVAECNSVIGALASNSGRNGSQEIRRVTNGLVPHQLGDMHVDRSQK